ncbi:MAG: ATP-dependent Clp protease ATP-binding subunit [Bacteroidales bacterium]|nr:ATP-dependent Clp protease ATP-binding subunit [Bacteroidales bacterium]
MNYELLSPETREAISDAHTIAKEQGFENIEAPILAIVLYARNRRMAESVLREKSLSSQRFQSAIVDALDSIPKSQNPHPGISPNLDQLLASCTDGQTEVSAEKVFRAIIQTYCPNQPRQERPRRQETTPRNGNPALSRYARDLKQLAAENKLAPVIGREAEVEQVLKTLTRKTKSNPLLVGEPGVGKTAVAEAVAMRIHNGNVPDLAASFHLYALDLSLMVAGASAMGQFEERLKAVMKEAKADPHIVLFIDEIHQLIGTGSNQAMDAANVLKPALARGEIKVIGATTFDEYRQYIEHDKAFERRFQMIRVEELSPEDTLTVLRGIKPSFEKFHGLTIEDAALEEAVELSQRFMTARFQPDKSIDVMDEAASNVRYNRGDTVTPDAIRAVIGKLTGIPVEKIGREEARALLNLEERLNKHVYGQDEAIAAMAAVIRRNKVNISDTTRPIGSFLCIGPTGVGKTELAKAWAEELMNSRDNLIRIDMSEYQHAHNVSRLFGAPPGYVGYGQGGQLTEAVRQKPYSVILLDEIEKAHPRVFETLLQVLDDGRMTDGEGRVVNFRNTLILMTSNIGSREIAQRRTPIGFNAPRPQEVETETALSAVKALFAPEFLNRLDGIIPFNALDRDLLLRIAHKQLEELKQRLADNGHQVDFDETVATYVVETDADPAYGARPIRRVIEQHIIEPITCTILENGGEKGLSIQVSVRDGQLSVETL